MFYEQDKDIEIDAKNNQVQIKGILHRTSRGLEVKPQPKAYLIQFAYTKGMMWPQSIAEVHE